MSQVALTIDNIKVEVKPGTTVLEAAKQAGIDIPTLCHHSSLVPIGACRICVVEVEGQRNLQAACVFPVMEGMVVQTESPRVVQARKFVLDMLFSERNHYCPFCEASGDCELQNLGYRYGIDHWVYLTYTKAFPVDATRQYFMMDHNRCVLCGRCIRACNELVANHTLGLRQRGAKSMVHADANLSFGESSCISCGSCMQVCPTGALSDNRSAFMGRDIQSEHVKSICSQCSVGCGIDIVTRAGHVLRIESDWEAAVNGGMLCKSGRFDPLDEKRQRIAVPLVRRQGQLQPASWSEALQVVAKRIDGAGAQGMGVLVSSGATNEALYLLNKLFRKELGVTNVGLLDGAAPKPFKRSGGSLADIVQSDVILAVGADPVKDQPIASFLMKRAVDRGARLVIVGGGEGNGLDPFAYQNLGMADIQQAVDMAANADRPVVLYGVGISEVAVKTLKKLEKKAAFISLEPGVNSRAAAAFGFDNGFKPSASKLFYVLSGEKEWAGGDLLEKMGKDAFVVVQASFVSPLTEKADVVLPTTVWSERTGSLTNTEGRVLKLNQAVEPEGEAKQDWEVLSLLADTLGKKAGASLDDISVQAAKELK